MTPGQHKELMDACERGDDVRIVTVALSIAATAARENRRNMSLGIREIVDQHLDKPSQVREYYRRRLEIAQHIMAGLLSGDAVWVQGAAARVSIEYADALMEANAAIPLGKVGTDEEGKT